MLFHRSEKSSGNVRMLLNRVKIAIFFSLFSIIFRIFVLEYAASE